MLVEAFSQELKLLATLLRPPGEGKRPTSPTSQVDRPNCSVRFPLVHAIASQPMLPELLAHRSAIQT